MLERGTVIESFVFALMPTARLLVCSSNRQLVWSAGQESENMMPLTGAVMFVGLVLMPLTTAGVPQNAKPVDSGTPCSLSRPSRGVR